MVVEAVGFSGCATCGFYLIDISHGPCVNITCYTMWRCDSGLLLA